MTILNSSQDRAANVYQDMTKGAVGEPWILDEEIPLKKETSEENDSCFC